MYGQNQINYFQNIYNKFITKKGSFPLKFQLYHHSFHLLQHHKFFQNFGANFFSKNSLI